MYKNCNIFCLFVCLFTTCHHQYMTTTKNIFVPQTFFFHKKQNEKKMVNEPESHIGHTKKKRNKFGCVRITFSFSFFWFILHSTSNLFISNSRFISFSVFFFGCHFFLSFIEMWRIGMSLNHTL